MIKGLKRFLQALFFYVSPVSLYSKEYLLLVHVIENGVYDGRVTYG